MQEIVLYTTHCPQCKILEEKLKEKQISYSVCDNVVKMVEKGFKQAPMLEANGIIMNFTEAIKWLKENGDARILKGDDNN